MVFKAWQNEREDFYVSTKNIRDKLPHKLAVGYAESDSFYDYLWK